MKSALEVQVRQETIAALGAVGLPPEDVDVAASGDPVRLVVTVRYPGGRQYQRTLVDPFQSGNLGLLSSALLWTVSRGEGAAVSIRVSALEEDVKRLKGDVSRAEMSRALSQGGGHGF